MKKFWDSYFIIRDDDQKLFNCFISSFPTSLWKEKINEAVIKGRNLSWSYEDKDKIKNQEEHILESHPDYKYTKDYLVDLPIDSSLN